MVTHRLAVKRIYEPASPSDGFRVLVDGLWPRGVAKSEAKIDLWLKEVAPSAALRRWFDHREDRWRDFQTKYAAELAANPALSVLRGHVKRTDVTLLYAARDTAHNHALVLADTLG